MIVFYYVGNRRLMHVSVKAVRIVRSATGRAYAEKAELSRYVASEHVQ